MITPAEPRRPMYGEVRRTRRTHAVASEFLWVVARPVCRPDSTNLRCPVSVSGRGAITTRLSPDTSPVRRKTSSELLIRRTRRTDELTKLKAGDGPCNGEGVWDGR